jgi:hypothetical protein
MIWILYISWCMLNIWISSGCHLWSLILMILWKVSVIIPIENHRLYILPQVKKISEKICDSDRIWVSLLRHSSETCLEENYPNKAVWIPIAKRNISSYKKEFIVIELCHKDNPLYYYFRTMTTFILKVWFCFIFDHKVFFCKIKQWSADILELHLLTQEK